MADATLAPMFARLGRAIQAHALPLQPFRDLLDAFMQDVGKTRYRDFDELRDYCREHLRGSKTPEIIEFRAELPKSNVGKILRRELRDAELRQVA